MFNLLNRKKQLSAFVSAAVAFVVLMKWATLETATAGGVVLLAAVSLVSRDDAPPEQTKSGS